MPEVRLRGNHARSWGFEAAMRTAPGLPLETLMPGLVGHPPLPGDTNPRGPEILCRASEYRAVPGVVQRYLVAPALNAAWTVFLFWALWKLGVF